MKKPNFVLLFSNKEQIINIMTPKYILPSEIDNQKWIYRFDSVQRKFVFFDDHSKSQTSSIFIVFDGGKDEKGLILNDEQLSTLRFLRNNSDQVCIVFHDKPSEKIKSEIRELFDENLLEYSALHEEPPSGDQYENSDQFLYFYIYNSLNNLFYNEDGSIKKSPETIFRQQKVRSVEEIVNVLSKRALIQNLNCFISV